MKKIAVTLTVLVALALPALALAKTLKQDGRIVGDRATSVSLKVKVKRGKATAITGFKVRKILTRCEKGGAVRFKYRILSPIPIEGRKFKERFKGGGTVLRIAGKVRKKGRLTVGTLKTNRFRLKGHGTCRTPKQRFKTSV